mgnify:FL=1
MYCNDNVAGTGRRVNRPNCITAEEFCRRRCPEGGTGPDTGRKCNFVYECLLELLQDAVEDNSNCNCNCNYNCPQPRNCNFVYECLGDLLEDEVEEDNNCGCKRYC